MSDKIAPILLMHLIPNSTIHDTNNEMKNLQTTTIFMPLKCVLNFSHQLPWFFSVCAKIFTEQVLHQFN